MDQPSNDSWDGVERAKMARDAEPLLRTIESYAARNYPDGVRLIRLSTFEDDVNGRDGAA